MIRSKVPTTKKEFGDNYIALGPLNEASIRTEVEIREPDIGALRAAIHAMRNAGLNVSYGPIKAISHAYLALYFF